ncbi:hypothetical protein [Streptomyces sp. KL116D]
MNTASAAGRVRVGGGLIAQFPAPLERLPGGGGFFVCGPAVRLAVWRPVL